MTALLQELNEEKIKDFTPNIFAKRTMTPFSIILENPEQNIITASGRFDLISLTNLINRTTASNNLIAKLGGGLLI